MCGKACLCMPKVIANGESPSWLHINSVTFMEVAYWFNYFKQSGSSLLALKSSLPIRLLDPFNWNISRIAWSFDSLFCLAVQHHDWKQLNKFWSFMAFGILCGFPLKSTLFYLLFDCPTAMCGPLSKGQPHASLTQYLINQWVLSVFSSKVNKSLGTRLCP